jgi:hypothetical protein
MHADEPLFIQSAEAPAEAGASQPDPTKKPGRSEQTTEPLLDTIELVHAHGHPFLHCMPCGATFGLHWDPLTVDTIVRCAQHHVPLCPGETDDF